MFIQFHIYVSSKMEDIQKNTTIQDKKQTFNRILFYKESFKIPKMHRCKVIKLL